MVFQGPSPEADYSVNGDFDASFDWRALNATPYSIAAEINSPDGQWLAQADALFITPSLVRLVEVYVAASILQLDNYLAFVYYLVAGFLTCFAVVMGGIFMPQVKQTNDDIQKKRTMLLFLPTQVVRGVRSIRNLIDDILSEDPNNHGSAASSSSGGSGSQRSRPGGAGNANEVNDVE